MPTLLDRCTHRHKTKRGLSHSCNARTVPWVHRWLQDHHSSQNTDRKLPTLQLTQLIRISGNILCICRELDSCTFCLPHSSTTQLCLFLLLLSGRYQQRAHPPTLQPLKTHTLALQCGTTQPSQMQRSLPAPTQHRHAANVDCTHCARLANTLVSPCLAGATPGCPPATAPAGPARI